MRVGEDAAELRYVVSVDPVPVLGILQRDAAALTDMRQRHPRLWMQK